MKPLTVWLIFTLFSAKTFATSPESLNPQVQFRQWFQERVNKTLAEKDDKRRWEKLERLIPDIRKYETDNDLNLDTEARDDISSLLVLYLPFLPSASDFNKAKCETYHTVFFSNAGVQSRKDLPALGRSALSILETFCPQK